MVWKQTAMLQDIQGKLDLLLSAQANNRQAGGNSDTVCSLDVSTRDMDLKRHLQDYVDTQISQKLRGQDSETFDSPDEVKNFEQRFESMIIYFTIKIKKDL